MTGVELIAAERQRQIDVELFGSAHDEEHDGGELAAAAECYAAYATDQLSGIPSALGGDTPMQWPLAPEWWKPSPDPTRNLAKAGALIAAELDRLNRKKPEVAYQCRCSGCGITWISVGEPGRCPNACNGDTIAYEPKDKG